MVASGVLVAVAEAAGVLVLVGVVVAVAVGECMGVGVGVAVGGAAAIKICPCCAVTGSDASPPTAAKFVTVTVSGATAPTVAVPETIQAISTTGSPGSAGALTPADFSENALNFTVSGLPSPLLSKRILQRPPSNAGRLILQSWGATNELS